MVRESRGYGEELLSFVRARGLISFPISGTRRPLEFGARDDFLVEVDRERIPRVWTAPRARHSDEGGASIRLQHVRGGLVASRDALGLCILLYTRTSRGKVILSNRPSWLLWALDEVRPNATRVARFLAGLDDLDSSCEDWIAGLRRVPPGHSAFFRRDSRSVTLDAWFERSCARRTPERTDGFYTSTRLARRIEEVLPERGSLLLSAGVDSSLLGAIAARRGSRWDAVVLSQLGHPSADESAGAREIARRLSMDLYELPLAASRLEPEYPPAEPWLGPSTSPGWLPESHAFSLLAQRGLPGGRLISGVGADELLGGGAHLWSRYRTLRGAAVGASPSESARGVLYRAWTRAPRALRLARYESHLRDCVPSWQRADIAQLDGLARQFDERARILSTWHGIRLSRVARLASWRWEGVIRAMTRHSSSIAPLAWTTPYLTESLWRDLADCPPTLSLMRASGVWLDKAIARRLHYMYGTPSWLYAGEKRDAFSDLFLERLRNNEGGAQRGVREHASLWVREGEFNRAWARATARGADTGEAIRAWRALAVARWTPSLT